YGATPSAMPALCRGCGLVRSAYRSSPPGPDRRGGWPGRWAADGSDPAPGSAVHPAWREGPARRTPLSHRWAAAIVDQGGGRESGLAVRAWYVLRLVD